VVIFVLLFGAARSGYNHASETCTTLNWCLSRVDVFFARVFVKSFQSNADCKIIIRATLFAVAL